MMKGVIWTLARQLLRILGLCVLLYVAGLASRELWSSGPEFAKRVLPMVMLFFGGWISSTVLWGNWSWLSQLPLSRVQRAAFVVLGSIAGWVLVAALAVILFFLPIDPVNQVSKIPSISEFLRDVVSRSSPRSWAMLLLICAFLVYPLLGSAFGRLQSAKRAVRPTSVLGGVGALYGVIFVMAFDLLNSDVFWTLGIATVVTHRFGVAIRALWVGGAVFEKRVVVSSLALGPLITLGLCAFAWSGLGSRDPKRFQAAYTFLAPLVSAESTQRSTLEVLYAKGGATGALTGLAQEWRTRNLKPLSAVDLDRALGARQKASEIPELLELVERERLDAPQRLAVMTRLRELAPKETGGRTVARLLAAKGDEAFYLDLLSGSHAAGIRYALRGMVYDFHPGLVPEVLRRSKAWGDAEKLIALSVVSMFEGKKTFGIERYIEYRIAGRAPFVRRERPDCSGFKGKKVRDLPVTEWAAVNLCGRLLADRRDATLLEALNNALFLSPQSDEGELRRVARILDMKI
ncbi:MAG: hypothetical protein IT285_02995 [Bdellovibrionales bacterium]|nr:hypothetical protein [Bdellovibrionales bacterium]